MGRVRERELSDRVSDPVCRPGCNLGGKLDVEAPLTLRLFYLDVIDASISIGRRDWAFAFTVSAPIRKIQGVSQVHSEEVVELLIGWRKGVGATRRRCAQQEYARTACTLSRESQLERTGRPGSIHDTTARGVQRGGHAKTPSCESDFGASCHSRGTRPHVSTRRRRGTYERNLGARPRSRAPIRRAGGVKRVGQRGPQTP
jgi:hypothetical protein